MTSPFVPVQPNIFGAQSPMQGGHQGAGQYAPQYQNYQNDPRTGQVPYNPEVSVGYGQQDQGYYNPQMNQGYGSQQAGYNNGVGIPNNGYNNINNNHGVNSGSNNNNSNSHMNMNNGGFNMFQNPQLEQLGMLANPLAQMGMAQASQFVATMNDSYLTRWTGSLRYYFSVNNSYVLSKLMIILCPFIHKSWSRKIVQAADAREMHLPPNSDVNAPDLYIPTMAFITYILLIAVIMATSSSGFKPDVLGMTASSGLVTLALEVFIIKLGFYLLSYPPVLVLDLVSYCGYKFVGIVIILCSAWLFGWLGFIVSFVFLALFMAVFMVKTLRLIVPQPMETTPRNVRNYALISIAILQGVFTGILCWIDSKNNRL